MKKALFRHLLLSAVFLTALGPLHARAQTIDYASLQTLFGEPVTTSATGKPQRVSEAPVDMEIITADDIRRSGAHDIAEVLRGASGVNVLQSARQDYDVGIRGYNEPYSPNLLVLVNGRQVYLDDHGYTNWATIPVQLSEIRQIEIVKGPNTALFGFNAADGVINIVTMNPLYDNTSDASVTGGTGSYRDASVVKTFKPSDSFGVRLSADASKANEFDDSVNKLEPPGVFISPEKDSVNLDSIVQVTEKSQLRLEASDSNVQQTEMTIFNILTDTKYQTSSLKTDYEADTPLGLVKATAYKNWLNTGFGADLYNPAETNDVNNNVAVMQLADTFKAGVSNTFRLQGEYRDNVVAGSIIGPTGSSVREDVYAASGMWEWAINDAWDLTNSVREDELKLSRSGPMDPSSPLTDADYSRTITKPSYNSGLVWKADQDNSFRLNTARGLRTPGLADFGLSFRSGAMVGPFPVFQIGNPDKEPTAVTDYELGWDHKVRDGMFKADVFTEKTTDELSPDGSVIACPAALGAPCAGPVPSDVIIQGNNIGWSDSVGLELDLKAKLNENWSWGVNDTVEKIHDHYTDPDFNTQDGTPVNLANFHLGYKDGPWEDDAFVYYNTRFKQPEPDTNITVPVPFASIPAHTSLSARTGYKLNDATTVSLSGQELLAPQFETSTALETERRVFLSLDRAF